jgi:hypothetical protein
VFCIAIMKIADITVRIGFSILGRICGNCQISRTLDKICGLN